MRALQIATVLIIAIAMALALAHALEWPGKRRLDRDTYLAVQTIYHPGFTFAGISEVLGIVLILLVVWRRPHGGVPFEWTIVSLACLVAMHAVFRVVTQPVNKFWLVHTNVSTVGVKVRARRQRRGHTRLRLESREVGLTVG